MDVYAAGVYSASFDLQSKIFKDKLMEAEREARRSVMHFLESFIYLNERPALVDKIRDDRV